MRFIPVLLLGFALMLWSNSAFADCTDPAGVEGDQTYNLTYKTMMFCDGTTWNSMKAANAGSGGDGDTLAGLSCSNNQIAKWNGSAWACAADMSGVTDGDKGDVTVSGSGATWTVDSGAVTSAKIADGTVAAVDLANNAVTSAKILDGTIATADVANGAVTPAKTDFVGTLTEGKWCTVSGGDIVCTSDAPGGGSGFQTGMWCGGRRVVGCSGSSPGYGSPNIACNGSTITTTCAYDNGWKLTTSVTCPSGFSGFSTGGSSGFIACVKN